MGSKFLLSANFSAGFGIVGVVPRDSLDANGQRIYDFMKPEVAGAAPRADQLADAY
jgi:hypothetical protein